MLLVARGFLSREQLEAALDEQLVSGRRLGEILVQRGFIPHSTLSLALAEQYGIHPAEERGFGSGLRVLLGLRSDDQAEIEAAPPPEATAATVVEEPEVPAVSHLEARLEEQWARLAAVQEQLATTEERLAALQRQHERRRAQAARLLARLRAQRPAHLAALEQLALSAQDLHALNRLHERRRAQAGRLLVRIRTRPPQLARAEQELDSLRRVHERRHAQAGRLLARIRTQQPARLAAVQEQLAATEEHLQAVTRLHERRHAQAGRLLARLRAQQRPDDRDEVADRGHLLFLQLERGYELLERDGRPPAADARLELADFPDSVFVVTSLGRSPLPNDRRSCAFAQPVSGRAAN